jgi:hypothetical protein
MMIAPTWLRRIDGRRPRSLKLACKLIDNRQLWVRIRFERTCSCY